jgi:hypothetical protein
MTRYRPNAFCPSCSRPAATRYYAAEVEHARTLDEDEPLHDVVCTRPSCGTVYLISAINLQTATPEPEPPCNVVDARRKAA